MITDGAIGSFTTGCGVIQLKISVCAVLIFLTIVAKFIGPLVCAFISGKEWDRVICDMRR